MFWQQCLLQAEEERKRKEEQEKKEHEEYLLLKEAFTVDEEGEQDAEADLSVSANIVCCPADFSIFTPFHDPTVNERERFV